MKSKSGMMTDRRKIPPCFEDDSIVFKNSIISLVRLVVEWGHIPESIGKWIFECNILKETADDVIQTRLGLANQRWGGPRSSICGNGQFLEVLHKHLEADVIC